MTFDSACALVQSALAGGFRRAVVESAARGDSRTALTRIREQMRSHRWSGGGTRVSLDALVGDYDDRTRKDGLHILNDWDGKADHVNPDTIPVDVATFLIDRAAPGPADVRTLAILVDYYFIYMLALLVVRVWDDNETETNFERLDGLLKLLQGSDGSGEQFVGPVETLLLIAGSHYERHEETYGRLLAQVRELALPRRRRIALSHAVSLGSHLRFGFEATYARDLGAMRDDNVVDYLWLAFSLATLVEAWSDPAVADAARARVAEAIASGLAADADAFLVGKGPTVLAESAAERQTVRDWVDRDAGAVATALSPYRPVAGVYSPLACFFNFSQNVLKGMIVDATLGGESRRLSLDDVLTGVPPDPVRGPEKLRLIGALMGLAQSRPDRIRGQLTPAIVYDVLAGRRAFGWMMRAIGPQAGTAE